MGLAGVGVLVLVLVAAVLLAAVLLEVLSLRWRGALCS